MHFAAAREELYVVVVVVVVVEEEEEDSQAHPLLLRLPLPVDPWLVYPLTEVLPALLECLRHPRRPFCCLRAGATVVAAEAAELEQ